MFAITDDLEDTKDIDENNVVESDMQVQALELALTELSQIFPQELLKMPAFDEVLDKMVATKLVYLQQEQRLREIEEENCKLRQQVATPDKFHRKLKASETVTYLMDQCPPEGENEKVYQYIKTLILSHTLLNTPEEELEQSLGSAQIALARDYLDSIYRNYVDYTIFQNIFLMVLKKVSSRLTIRHRNKLEKIDSYDTSSINTNEVDNIEENLIVGTY